MENVRFSATKLHKNVRFSAILDLYFLNLRSQSVQALVNILIPALNLVAVVDDAGAVGGEGGDEQGDAGADVGRGHADAS